MSFRSKQLAELILCVALLILVVEFYPDYYKEKQESIEKNTRIIEMTEKQIQREEEQKRRIEAQEAQKAKEDMEFLKEIRKKREHKEPVVRSRHMQIV